MMLRYVQLLSKILFLVVNNGRVLLQQFLGVRSENAFLALKLHQLLVHKLDVALGDHCSQIGLIIIFDRNHVHKKSTQQT